MKLRQACLCIFVISIALGSCGHRDTGLLPGGQGQPVAAYGDSEPELTASIQAASAAGKKPVYVTLTAPNKSYVFSVYAQILRSQHSIVAVGYNHIYSFRPDVQIAYDGNPVASSDIPLVNAPVIDARAEQAQPGKFLLGLIKMKQQLCPDCLLLIVDKKSAAGIAARWSSVQDPWQINPAYVAWQPAPPTAMPSVMSLSEILKPNFIERNPAPSCGVLNSACTGCYSMFGRPVNPLYCAGGSSFAGGGPQPPAPTPGPCDGAFLASGERRVSPNASGIASGGGGGQVIEHIDQTLPASDRAVMADLMKRLPANQLNAVMYFAPDRNYANSSVLLSRMERWPLVRDNLYRMPSGKLVPMPPLPTESEIAQMKQVGQRNSIPGEIGPQLFVPPGPGIEGGAMRQEYSQPFFNDITSQVFLPCQASPGDFGPNGDTGYIYESAYGTTGDELEGGFQYSPSRGGYSLYLRHGGTRADGNATIPCGSQVVLNVYVFPALNGSSSAYGVVFTPGEPVLTTNLPPNQWPANAFLDNVARLTTIAQDHVQAYSDGWYFGIQQNPNGTSTPTVIWSGTTVADIPCTSEIPWIPYPGGTQNFPDDQSRVLVDPFDGWSVAYGSEIDGINLHF